MNERFRANLAAIAAVDPPLAEALAGRPPSPRIVAAPAADGGVTVTIAAPGGAARLTLPDLSPDTLADRTDELEGARMTVVAGFGSGRLLTETLARSGPDSFVLLVEPDLDLFAALLAHLDLARLVADERLGLAVGEPPRDAIIGQAEKRFGISTLSRVARVETPGVRPLYPDYYAAIDREVEHLLAFALQNRVALAEQGLLWRRNILANLAAIVASPPVSALFDAGRGGAALLVSAGPSLDRTIPMIAAAKGRIPLIAVDSALKPLAARGIAPDLVVSVDANEANLRHLDGVDLSETWMVLHPAVHPAIARLACKGRLFFGGPDPLVGFIEARIGPRGDLLTGGTVAATTFDLARKMGLSPLLFTGQDLSFTEDASHATGAAYRQARDPRFVGDARPLPDLFGRPVRSNTKMLAWRRWFEIALVHHKVAALNATGGGLTIDGAPSISLAEGVARYGALPFPAIEVATGDADPESLAHELRGALTETRQVKTVCGRGIAAVRKNAPLAELSPLAQQILANERFVEINRYWVDEALDEIDGIQRALRAAPLPRREALTREAWRQLFARLYDAAAGLDRDLAAALVALEAGVPA